MAEFDYQWRNLPADTIEYNDSRVHEFQKFTMVDLTGKFCLDAGCGNGRYTYAMIRLGADNVDSFDISTEAVSKCKEVNRYAFVCDIMDLQPRPAYDFVLCWGVLHHLPNPRKAFSKLVSQVSRNGGILHIMVYHRETQNQYKEYRYRWNNLSFKEKLELCHDMVERSGGTVQ